MTHIPVSLIHVSPGTQVRASLLKSIQEKGILTPILAQRNGSGYKVLDGRRRVAAAMQVGIKEIPAILIEQGGPEVTLLAHATRSENPVAELEAIQELQRNGLSEKEIARAGYASLARIRRVSKLNRLAPELADRVEAGEIAPGVAFQIANLSQEEQRQLLAVNEKLTSKTVRQVKYAQRKAAIAALPELVEQVKPVSIEELFSCLSFETLAQVLKELPTESRFEVWRVKIKRLLEESEMRDRILTSV
jgi:ParB family chromosome partitioning protein